VPLLLGIAVASCSDAIAPNTEELAASGRVRTRTAAVGDTFRLAPLASRERGAADSIVWEVEDSTVALVENGLVIPVGAGETKVTARLQGGEGAEAVDAAAAAATYLVSVIWGDARTTGVIVMPETAAMKTGDTLDLLSQVVFSSGARVNVRVSPSWTVSDTSLGRVVSGRFIAKRAGVAKVTAKVGSVSDFATVTITGTPAPAPSPAPSPSPAPTPGELKGHIVSPTGTSSGDGTAAKPWDLRTALSHPSKVKAGDTIFVRGGTYRGIFTSTLTGTSSAPIVVRAAHGERATIDANGGSGTILKINGGDAVFWGLEVTDSRRTITGKRGSGVELYGPRTKLVNMVIHDATENGVGFWTSATDAEIYGSLIYNNGFQSPERGSGHGIYSQNKSGVKRIVDNVVFNQYGWGVHIYGSTTASLVGYHVEGNTVLNNGAISSVGGQNNVLIGGGSPASNITVTNNVVYRSPSYSGVGMRLGYQASPAWNQDVTVRNNVVFDRGQALIIGNWRNAKVSGNTLAGYLLATLTVADPAVVGAYDWRDNTHLGSAGSTSWMFGTTRYTWADWRSRSRIGGSDRVSSTPSTPQVIVRPNRYEAGRANIVVVNWSGAGSASADVSGVLKAGDAYEIRDAQNFYGPVVATGTYSGGSISLSLSPRAPAAPINGASRTPIATANHLATFVLLRR